MSQNRDDLPYFPLYASNIVADKRYRLMSPPERAIWISILLECWPNGSVPAEPAELAKYLGFSVEDVKAGLTERVLSFFQKLNGELISPQLEKYWGEVLARRLKQSEGGKKGVKLKRDKALKGQGQPQPTGKPRGQPKGEPEGSLNTIRLNQIQSLEKEVTNDPWLAAYDDESRKVKVMV